MNASAVPSRQPTGWFSRHRLIAAVLLHGLWKLRWYQTVFALWPMLIIAAWGASPYFMVYVVGMPEPGTAPRYVGTVRFEGELKRTKTGWTPPKYFIQTSSGEMEFHCGYQPYFRECGRFHGLIGGVHAADIYEIGYAKYWGVDYIKYPAWLTHLDDDSVAKQVTSRRLMHLEHHFRSMLWFGFLVLVYLYFIWHAYSLSNPNRQMATDNSLAPLKPADFQQSYPKPKRPTSFFD